MSFAKKDVETAHCVEVPMSMSSVKDKTTNKKFSCVEAFTFYFAHSSVSSK